MVSGQYGLGYVINTSYTMVRYPTIVIGMITLGAVGYVTSAMVRLVGDYLMQWRTRELALGRTMMTAGTIGEREPPSLRPRRAGRSSSTTSSRSTIPTAPR